MPIQVLGLRRYYNNVKKKESTKTDFFTKNMRARSVPDLLMDYEKILQKIPAKERYNMFFTVADCHERSGRQLKKQTTIMFDIDSIDHTRLEEYWPPIFYCLQTEFAETGIINSGNGLHIFIESDVEIDYPEYFEETRLQYKAICTKINEELKKRELPGFCDDAVWKSGVMGRFPGTTNKKTPETGYKDLNSEKPVEVIQRVMIVQPNWCVERISGIEVVQTDQQVSPQALKRFAKPDTESVLKECLFMKHCQENPADIKENDWYKMLSISSRLDDGRELSHQISMGHPGYNESECNSKIDQALLASGPRTCKNIETSFEGCVQCPHYEKITSPIVVKNDDYIASKDTGFYHVTYDLDGKPKRGKPQYDDLLRFFKKQHIFKSTYSKLLYLWEGTNWKFMPDSYIETFCEEHMDPKPSATICNEFKAKVFRNNLVDDDWFTESTFRKMNMKNCVVDLEGGTVRKLDHSPQFGFLNTLPYDYDPNATCPQFNKFMKDITCERKELEDILLEYAGYSFGDGPCTVAKALLCLGGGANGKSTFINVLKNIAGRKGYSSVSIGKLNNEQHLAQLHGKLFNIMEETPKKTFLDSSEFKNIVSGGDITVKVVYKPPYQIRNRAKIIMCMNDMPDTSDSSDGFMRRLLIIPFDRTFKEKEQDIRIEEKLLSEASGILNRIIEGNINFEKNGFTKSDIVTKEIEDYRLFSDPIFSFFKEYIEITDIPEDTLSISNTYSAYKDYCMETGVKVMNVPTIRSFSNGLGKYIPNWKNRRNRTSDRRVYTGLILNNPGSDY